MSKNDSRRHFQPDNKYEIVKEVLIGKYSVSEVSRDLAGQYYNWQQAFLNSEIKRIRHKKSGRYKARKKFIA